MKGEPYVVPSSNPSGKSSSHKSRFRGIDGVTQDERDLAPTANTSLRRAEALTQEAKPEQAELFPAAPTAHLATVADIPPLHANATLPLARTWYRRDLERKRRPANTIKAYSYDLMVLEQLVGPKHIHELTSRDIARYLGDASSKVTRKRRLTSARRFFRFLIEERVIDADPTEGYFPHHIELRLPMPLFPDEQQQLLDAAADDEPWSEIAVWLMMRLGLTRSELLALRRDEIDRTIPHGPVIYIYYADRLKRSKERTLVGDARFAELYEMYLQVASSSEELFPVGPPAVNSMIERVRRAADISKAVTPQVLRHTFAVDQARNGADQGDLLKLLGLADDPRNRQSVDRYLRLAHPVNEQRGI